MGRTRDAEPGATGTGDDRAGAASSDADSSGEDRDDGRDDEADFRQFVSSRWPALVTTAYLITTDRGIAEDCVQEALTRVHRRWGRLRREGNPAAYAHRAVVNAALSWRRRGRIREVPLNGEQGAATVEPVDQSLRDVDADLLAALRSLPPRMRAAVVLRYLEDRSEAETAGLLGCSVGTVKSATSRGVTRLRSALEPTAADPGAAAPATRATRNGLEAPPSTTLTGSPFQEGAR